MSAWHASSVSNPPIKLPRILILFQFAMFLLKEPLAPFRTGNRKWTGLFTQIKPFVPLKPLQKSFNAKVICTLAVIYALSFPQNLSHAAPHPSLQLSDLRTESVRLFCTAHRFSLDKLASAKGDVPDSTIYDHVVIVLFYCIYSPDRSVPQRYTQSDVLV